MKPGEWHSTCRNCSSHPSCKGHRFFANIVYKYDGKVWFSEHAALPFGAVASVHGWDRIGAANALGMQLCLTRRESQGHCYGLWVASCCTSPFSGMSRAACLLTLHTAELTRYVDDFYGPERCMSSQHAMRCFARLPSMERPPSLN